METKRKSAKVVVSLLALAGLAVFSLFAVGGSLQPSAPPGPTMKTLDEVEPRTPILSVPYTISESGSYYLTGDLTYTTTTGNAITVNADNLTIDLMGYSLIGPGKESGTNYGICMNGRSNVEIRNGTVRGFGSHCVIEFDSSNGKEHRVISVRALSNGGSGIMLSGRSHLIKDCTAAENGFDGIYAGYGSTITGNTCYNNRYGIHARNGCTVTGNTAWVNTDYGIFVSNYCLIDQNTAYLNGTNMTYGTGCQLGLNVAP